MEERRKITSGNKIPGCEKLTRPEEIQGLSKYLGAIRDTQEQWISENMPNEPLETYINQEELDLPSKRIDLEKDSDYRLPKNKETLEINDLELKTSRVDLKPGEDVGIGEELIELQGVKEPDLPKELSRLAVGDDLELPKTSDKLYPGKEPDLPKNKDLIHPSDPNLKPDLVRLKNVESPELPESKVGLNVENKDKLPGNRVYLRNTTDVSLPNSKEELKNIQEPDLPETIVNLIVQKDPGLPTEKELLKDIKDPELPKDSLSLHVTSPDDLSNHIEKLFVPDQGLREGKIGLDVTEPDRLPFVIFDLDPTFPDDLPSDRINIRPETDPGLPKDRLDINPVDPELPDSKIMIDPEEIKELPKSSLKIDAEDIKELPNSLTGLNIGEDPERVEEVLESMGNNELYDGLMKLLISGKSGREGRIGSGNLELASIISAYLGSSQVSDKRAKEAASKISEILEKQKRLLEISTESPDISSLSAAKIPNEAEILDESQFEAIQDKYKAWYSSDPKHRSTYQVPGETDPTKDPSKILNPAVYDQDRYIRRLAEYAANAGESYISSIAGGSGNIPFTNSDLSSSTRQFILKNTLMALVMARAKLERATKTDRSRLPGGSAVWQGVQELVQGGLTGPRDVGSVIRGVSNLLVNTVASDTALPQNRPEGKSNILTGELKETQTEELSRLNKNYLLIPNNVEIGTTAESIKAEISSIKGQIRAASNREERRLLKDLFKDTINDYKKQLKNLSRADKMIFTRDYLSSEGIELTLKDLCSTDPKNITTIEDFYTTLKNSPYITTPAKIINRRGGNLTLDTNAYWEVVIEPFLSYYQNGGYSYLPSIGEINYENEKIHGVNTAYSNWIPISNFELQKSKLVSKSLGLFDGEINYPTSVEYTNEFRITVVDDQYKSWRRYFQKCSDVSVYFSQAHKQSFYRYLKATPTAIDKTSVCIAFYKNITFRIRVYCMTPQYSTIKKFDLLCVMKDFVEEYSGEVDGGASDLIVSFSIVGENPPTYLEDWTEAEKENTEQFMLGAMDLSADLNDEIQKEIDEETEAMFQEDLKNVAPPSIEPDKVTESPARSSGSGVKKDDVQAETPTPARIRTVADLQTQMDQHEENMTHAPYYMSYNEYMAQAERYVYADANTYKGGSVEAVQSPSRKDRRAAVRQQRARARQRRQDRKSGRGGLTSVSGGGYGGGNR